MFAQAGAQHEAPSYGQRLIPSLALLELSLTSEADFARPPVLCDPLDAHAVTVFLAAPWGRRLVQLCVPGPAPACTQRLSLGHPLA